MLGHTASCSKPHALQVARLTDDKVLLITFIDEEPTHLVATLPDTFPVGAIESALDQYFSVFPSM